MAAARGRAQRNEFNMHLDSAGHGGWRQGARRHAATQFVRGRKVWERCAQIRMRALKCCTGHSFESVDFEQV